MPAAKFSRPAICAAILACLLAAACLAPRALAGMDTAKTRPLPSPEPHGPEPTYSVAAGFDGDIFPALANYLSFQRQAERTSGTITVTISNSGKKSIQQRVTVELPGWSDQEIQVAQVAPGEVRNVYFAPTFLPRFYSNREIAAATAKVTVSEMAGRELWATTVPVRLRSADDMYWGKDFEYARFIASWVTPHDPEVELILSRAKELLPGRRLPGYEEWSAPGVQEKSTYLQVKAIYTVVRQRGLSYVKSSSTLGAQTNADISERVRMPAESLREMSANCIDGVVLYASLFENLGLDPVVVLVPGHAYLGVKLAQDSDHYLYLETALTGRASFETAVSAAEKGLKKRNPADVLQIPVANARQAGIFPMPTAVGGNERLARRSSELRSLP